MKRSIIFILMVLLAAGCTHRASDDRQCITVSIAPLARLARSIVGDGVRVEVLIPSGASPESFEPTPRQIADMIDSRAVYTVGLIEFERSLTARGDIAPIRLCEGIETLGGHSHGNHSHGVDPHIWTSPVELRIMAANMYRSLKSIFPDSTVYDERYARLDRRLEKLDRDIAAQLAESGRECFVIYHPALTYYARAYGIEQISIEHEGKQPSARRLKELIDRARRDGLHCVLYQKPFPESVVSTVAEGMGAEPIEIDPLAYDIDSSLRAITRIIAR